MNKKLSIAFVCDPIGSNKSGVVVSTLRFGALLKERGHNVIFIGASTKLPPEKGTEDMNIYRYRSLPIPKSGGWRLAFPTIRELKKVFKEEKIDIVHVTLPMTGAVVATIAAQSLNIKVIAHSHSQPENIFMDMPKITQPHLYQLWNKYLAWIYGKAEALIYPTHMAKNLLHGLSDKDQPSRVVSNGINLNEYRPQDIGDFYNRFNIPNGKINILYVGRLFPEKRVDTLIKSIPYIIKEVSNINIIIVGGGHLRSKLEKLVESLNVAKYVTFLGLVNDEDKIAAYNASDIFVLPSAAELEGMVVLEAMACGKPVIIANSEASASRYFVDNNGFLFNLGDPMDLAEKILVLVKDENLRKQMSEASLLKVMDYDIHKSVDLLESLYYSTL